MPSDHAPVTVSFKLDSAKFRDDSQLLERSSMLGSYPHTQEHCTKSYCKKPIPFRTIDKDAFTLQMQNMTPPVVSAQNLQETLSLLDDIVYKASKKSRSNDREIVYSSYAKQNTRWKRILQADDTKSLWKGIDWKGEFKEVQSKDRPPELAFQEHMERLLNPDQVDSLEYPTSGQVSIPSLDDPFAFDELDYVVKKQVKPDKGCGPNGTAPGTLKLMPTSWLVFLLSLCVLGSRRLLAFASCCSCVLVVALVCSRLFSVASCRSLVL